MAESVNLDGVERRAATCQEIYDLEQRVDKCKEAFEDEIETLNDTVASVKSEVHGLRGDVHRMTDSIVGIKASLDTIATNMTKMTDFPETWEKIQGFWAVMRWGRDNFVPIAVVLGALGYVIYTIGRNTGLMPQ